MGSIPTTWKWPKSTGTELSSYYVILTAPLGGWSFDQRGLFTQKAQRGVNRRSGGDGVELDDRRHRHLPSATFWAFMLHLDTDEHITHNTWISRIRVVIRH